MTTIIVEMRSVVDRTGRTMSFLNWSLRFRRGIAGSFARASCIDCFIDGRKPASWYANVGKNLVMSLRSRFLREKKKLKASMFSSSHCCAMVWAIVDFPEPAGPWSQHIGWSSLLSTHAITISSTLFRVSSWHVDACSDSRSEELYAALRFVCCASMSKTDAENGHPEVSVRTTNTRPALTSRGGDVVLVTSCMVEMATRGMHVRSIRHVNGAQSKQNNNRMVCLGDWSARTSQQLGFFKFKLSMSNRSCWLS